METRNRATVSTVKISTIIHSGAKYGLQRLRDERGGQNEQLFYVPKCMYIDCFAARGANMVNRLGAWERMYSVTL